MRFCFGPVPSRRLGRSLGVDILPRKTCNLNCIYCELGPTKTYACVRAEYTPVLEICREIKEAVAGGTDFDALTITASGEPTLHATLGEILACARALTDRPLAVLTNGTLFIDPAVRRDVAQADIVLPSLDAALARSFRRVDRPALCVEFGGIISGLAALRKEFSGRIWLETLLVKGVNDAEEDLIALREAYARIGPDAVHLNTVVRPPAVPWARPLTGRELDEARAFLQEGLDVPVEIVADTKKRLAEGFHPLLEREILDMLLRRPMRQDEIANLINCDGDAVGRVISGLLAQGRVSEEDFEGKTYYRGIVAN